MQPNPLDWTCPNCGKENKRIVFSELDNCDDCETELSSELVTRDWMGKALPIIIIILIILGILLIYRGCE